MMVIVHFFEKKNLVLSQLLREIPATDENIKIKGRKGKVLSIEKVNDRLVHVHVHFEQIVKKPLVKDTKNKKR
jgi:hypothetical protein